MHCNALFVSFIFKGFLIVHLAYLTGRIFTMVLDDLPNLEDIYTSLCSSTMGDSEMDFDSGLEDDDTKSDSILEDSTIFVAFKGNIDDKDFKWKLDTILENVPNLLCMGNLLIIFSSLLTIFKLLWFKKLHFCVYLEFYKKYWIENLILNAKLGFLSFFLSDM